MSIFSKYKVLIPLFLIIVSGALIFGFFQSKDKNINSSLNENSNETTSNSPTQNNNDINEETATDNNNSVNENNNNSVNENNNNEEPNANNNTQSNDTNTNEETDNNGTVDEDATTDSETITPTEPTPTTPEPEESFVEQNAILAQEIIDLYRVSVLYDNKAYYTQNGVSATKTSESDGQKVNEFLKELKIYLGHFPQSILDTLRMEVGFSIHILKSLPGGKAGFAVFQPYGSYRMVLDVDTNLVDKILYHETFHLMDRYMYWQNGGSDAFPEWESLNPDAFVYGTTTSTYTWIDKMSNIEDIAFVSTYSKTNVLEDRADLFADLMFRSTKKTFMNTGYGINKKALYLDSIITKYFGNIPNARWKRWISY